jgi:CRISPR/Cas system-associated exonuclease Cas4 (RecB family)
VSFVSLWYFFRESQLFTTRRPDWFFEAHWIDITLVETCQVFWVVSNYKRNHSMATISKTTYLTYTQCPKAFWLAEYQPDLAAPPDPAAQRRLRAGQEVDKRARDLFPNGRLIPYRPQPADMTTLTAEAIAGGAETLFQATLAAADLLIKADILTRTASSWHLIEVKSATSYKATDHLPDVAFQLYVLRQAGLPVTQVSLMHLNKACRYPDLADLFTLTDVTAAAEAELAAVKTAVSHLRHLNTQPTPPDVGIGRHCADCPFRDHCWQGITGWTIYDIPYLKRNKEEQLEAANVCYVTELPPDFALGDKRAAAFVERVQQRQIAINAAAIRAELAALVYPLYFFDFETIDFAIPSFTGCGPYQQTPFQYSCHILHADGALTHCDYLHTTPDDPRRALAESLLAHIGPTGHLVAYNIPFERGVLLHLADQFPEFADRLRDLADRLWDQLTIFRQHYQHHGFARSNSLKAVLPIIVPALSYKTLAVQNGMQAQVVWEAMLAEQDAAAKEERIAQLRAYCGLDTLAMVEIHRALSAL